MDGDINMDMRTRARSLLVRGVLLLGGLALFAIVINLSWFDESLHPDIAQLSELTPVALENNAYPLIHGFSAADDKDPRAAGLAIIEALRARYRRGLPINLSDDEMAGILGGSSLDEAWQARFESLRCNSRLSLGCADDLLAEIASGPTNDARLPVLLARYEQILRATRFEENQEFDATTPIPDYGLLMTAGRVRLAMRYHSESTADFIRSVAADLAFWRRMLRDGQSLIAKMVGLAGIRNDVELLSALMRNRDLGTDDVVSIERVVPALSDDERDIGEAFVAELRVVLLSGKAVALMPPDPSWVTRLLLQERATLNEFYLTSVVPIRLRATLGPAAFYEQRGFERLTYDVRAFPPPLYNLGGKLLLKRQARAYNVQDYISRVHDLDGRLTLVALQAEIEQNPGRSVQSIVDASAHRNPYTRQPMHYDPDAGTIGFDCLADNQNDVCAVAIVSRRR